MRVASINLSLTEMAVPFRLLINLLVGPAIRSVADILLLTNRAANNIADEGFGADDVLFVIIPLDGGPAAAVVLLIILEDSLIVRLRCGIVVVVIGCGRIVVIFV